MKMEHKDGTYSYVVYHNDDGYALLVLEASVGSNRTIVGPKGKTVDVFGMKSKEFDGKFCKVSKWNGFEDHLTPSSIGAHRMLGMKLPITEAALGHIERALDMDTRGKTSEQIRAEVVKLSNDLPKGHALRNVPKSYPDRGLAIAAYTSVRQVLFNLEKESNMATKKVEPEAVPATKPAKAAKPDPKPVKAAKPVAEPAPAPAPVKATKKATPAPVAEPAAKPVKEKAVKVVKENGTGDPEIAKIAAANKAAWKGVKGLSMAGPFKLGEFISAVKTPEELRIHEGSARYTLIKFCLDNRKGHNKGFTPAELKESVGDQWSQALVAALKRGYLTA